MGKVSNNKKIWLSPPHLSGREIDYINDAFQKNWVTTIGENIDFFESALEVYLKDKKVALVNSCTSAIHLALILLNVEKNDEIICQSLTFAGSAFPILYQGAKPIFVDSEKDTWNISPDFLEQSIKESIKRGKKPKAIIAVHLYGMPYKVSEIKEISNYYNIPIIEDAAEALGSQYKGKKCGTFGQFATISFNGNKIITTSGGGALVCPDQNEKDKAIYFATQARDPEIYYEHQHIGYNYRISNILAGIGRSQMDMLEDRILARRANFNFYKKCLEDYDDVQLQKEPNSDFYSNHWLTAITINSSEIGKTREDLRLALLKENIESRLLWKPMHLQPIFENSLYYGEKIAENLFKNGLCLPSGSNLNDEDKQRISLVIKRVLG